MPDNKKYIIEIDGIEGQSVKDANWWAEKKDSLYAKYPEARVFEVADYDENDSNENDQYLIGIPGMEGASVKDFAWLSEKKDSLYQKYPDAKVLRARQVDYWYDKAVADEKAIEELQGEITNLRNNIGDPEHYQLVLGNPYDPELSPKEYAEFEKTLAGISDEDVAQIGNTNRENDQRLLQEKEQMLAQMQADYDANPRVVAFKEYAAQMEQQRYAQVRQEAAAGAKEYKDKVAKTSADMRSPAHKNAQHAPGYASKEETERWNKAVKDASLAANDPKGKNLNAANAFFEAYDYLLENKRSVAQGAWYNIWESVGEKEYNAVHAVLEKLEKKYSNLNAVTAEQIDAALTKEEKILLEAYFLCSEEEAKTSGAFQGGQIAGESLLIGGEMLLWSAAMYLTGGAAAPAAGASVTVSLGRGAMKITTSVLKAVGKWALKNTLKAAAFTAVAPTTYTHIARKRLQISESGKLMDDASDIAKYAAEEVIENFTEFSGEGILKAFGYAGDALKGTKWGAKAASAVGNSKFGKAMSWLSNTEGMQFMGNLGFQGLPIEVLEELEGAVLNEVTGLNGDALEQFFDADNAAAMLIGFAPMTLFGAGASAANMGLAKHNLNSTEQNLYNMLSQNYSKEQIDNVINSAMSATNPNEVAAALRPLVAGLAGGGATQEQLAALLDYGKAVASYKSMMTVNEERDRSLIDAKYTEIESSVGDFWVKMAEDIDAVRQVRVAELKDGRTVFVTSQANEQGEFTIKDAKTGQTGFAKESDIAEQQDEQGNAIRLDNTMNIDDFLNGEIMAERHSSEAKRMSDERQAQIDAMKQRLAANKQINLGTEEAPQIVLAQSTNSNGVTVVDETGNSAMLTWEQVGNAIGTPLNVRTDEQVVEQEIADLLARQAERKAALAQKNVIAPAQADKAITEAEQSIEAANPMHIPTNPDGSVDENAFWNENPEGWAEWNDQQNNDGGVDSYEQITAAKAELTARLAEMQKLQATSNPANRRQAKAEAQQISARLAKIDALEKQYAEKLQTPGQKRAAVEQAIKDRVEQWKGLTGAKFIVVENVSEVKNAQAAKAMAGGAHVMAWVNGNTAYVFLPNIDSVEMLDQKFAHEVVAHIGIKQLLGEEGYKSLCEKVWTVMSPTAQRYFLAYPAVKGNPILAADEYIAHIAEKVGSGVLTMEEQSVWQKIVQFVKEMLNKILGVYAQELTEQEILNNIKLSFANLMEKGASQVATEETQLSAKQPSNAELALQDYAADMTTSEMTSAVSYELGAAQKAYEDLLNNPVAISEGEGLKEYAARKAQYQEDLRRAKEEYELRKEMLDFLNSKQETKADNGVISGNIYGAEGATLAAAVNQKNNVFGQGVPGLDAVSTANYFYLYENAKNAGYAYSNGEINVTFGIPIKGNEEYIKLITEELENGTFENNEAADLSIEEIVSRQGQGTGNRADVAAQRGGYERNDSSLGNGAVDGVSDDGASIADSQLNAGESAGRPASIDNTSAPRSLEPTIVETENGEAVAETDGNGSVRFSALTYEQGGRDYLVNWLAREKYMDKAEKDFIIATLDQQYELAKRLGEEFPAFGAWSSAEINLDEDGNPVMSVIKPNGDYSMNLDFSLICKKRRPLNALLDVMIADRMLDMRQLDEAEIATINKVIQRHGFEVACALCFVDSKRYRVVKVAKGFADMYNKLVESLIPAGSDIVAYENNYAGYEYIKERNEQKTGRDLSTVPASELNWEKVDEILKGVKRPKSVEQKIAWALRKDASQRRLVNATDFVTNLGFESVKKNNPELLKIYNAKKGTGGPKASFGDVQYLNDILKSGKFTADKAAKVGGVRIQSFSDYMGHMFFDYMQMVAELSAKGLTAHAYTKEEAFARIFGMTGIKINMSLVPAVAKDGVAAGLDAEGNYVWAVPYTDEQGNEIQGQTFPPEVAFELQRDPRYSGNLGVIAVGVSDEHIMKMLNDENIHFIIPYHKSSLNPIVAKMTGIDQYEDYTDVQNEKLVDKPQYANLESKQKAKIINKRKFDFYGSLARTNDPKVTAKEYLEHCKKNDLVPKYEAFSKHENYYKLLADFNLYDFVTGEYAPQAPVKMNFPEELNDLVRASVAHNEQLESDLKDKVGKMAEDVKAELGGTRFSARTDEQRQALFDKAKAQFGLTNNFNAAGYMLPDGSLLDFSEANDGGNPNQRSQDHREIEGIIMDEGIEYDSRWMYLADFMNEGAIRLLPEYAGINLMKAPTKEQRQRLFDFIYKYNGEVILEIADERLNNVAYVEYDRRTSPSRIFRDIDGYFNEGIVPQQDTRFSASNNNQEIFVSNAAKAVEGIKQEKATPAQWLAMLEKNGGLKAAEDKWMGLSDWLKASDKKTLTKAEVLEFVNEHMIQIEETHYDAYAEEKVADAYAEMGSILQDKFNAYRQEYYEQNEDEDLYGNPANDYAIERLREELGDEFPYAIEMTGAGDVYFTFPYEEDEDMRKWSEKLGVEYNPQAQIENIRLGYTTDGLTNKREIALTVPTIESWDADDITHFGDAGDGRAVVWIRFGETTDESGNKVLVIDEIQSKRHQEGREKGYRTSREDVAKATEAFQSFNRAMKEKYGENVFPSKWNEEDQAEFDRLRDEHARVSKSYDKGIPAAPFEKNWHELAMKRMLRYAAENGYDVIAWTKGAQQAERYDLSQAVTKISASKQSNDGERIVNIYFRDEYDDYKNLVVDKEGKVIYGDFYGSNLADVVGKEMALQIMRSTDAIKFAGEGLSIGGEGMKGFYDKMLPAFMNKYGKKWGVKVSDMELPNLGEDGLTMHSVPVTDEMTASVMEGQLMFSIGNNPQTDAMNAKQLKVSGGMLTDEQMGIADIRFSITKNNRATIEKWLRMRKDLNSAEKRAFWMYIEDKAPAMQMAIGRWFAKGAIRLPEDLTAVEDAFKFAQKMRVNAMDYETPAAIIKDYADRFGKGKENDKEKRELLSPDNERFNGILTNKVDYGNGIVVYDVQNDMVGQKAVRELINDHLGTDVNIWCLLYANAEGEPTEGAEKMWWHYNSTQKKVMFYNGEIAAFCASDKKDSEWWDLHDKSHGTRIPVQFPVEGDRLGRSSICEFDGKKILPPAKGEHYFRGNKKKGRYEEWANKDASSIVLRTIRKGGKEDGLMEEWDGKGNLIHKGNYKASKAIGHHVYYSSNGQVIRDVTYDQNGKQDGFFRLYEENGNPISVRQYVHGRPEGEWLEYENGKLKSTFTYENGILTGYQIEYDKNGKVVSQKYHNTYKDGNYTMTVTHENGPEGKIVGVKRRLKHDSPVIESLEIEERSGGWFKKPETTIYVRKGGTSIWYSDKDGLLSYYSYDQKSNERRSIGMSSEGIQVSFWPSVAGFNRKGRLLSFDGMTDRKSLAENREEADRMWAFASDIMANAKDMAEGMENEILTKVQESEVRFSVVPHESTMDEVDSMFKQYNGDPFVRKLYGKVSELANGKEKAKEMYEQISASMQDAFGGDLRFSFIGEKGASALDKFYEATTRIDNLAIAREMENKGDDARAIKYATGWERGADGKWRYEIGDYNFRLTDEWRKAKTLGDAIEHDELFAAYPELKEIVVDFDDNANSNGGNFNPKENKITIRATNEFNIRHSLIHEIQHAIQHKEGFARGASVFEMAKRSGSDAFMLSSKHMNEMQQAKFIADSMDNNVGIEDLNEMRKNAEDDEERRIITDIMTMMADGATIQQVRVQYAHEYSKALRALQREVEAPDSPYNQYLKVMGEVESRNTSRRQFYSEAKRRSTLASETEDIAREDQIFLGEALDGILPTASENLRFSVKPEVRAEMDGILANAMVDGLFERDENGEVHMLAPNGKRSNLDMDKWALVRTANFKNWFGDWENDPENASKVVDPETKEPMVVYHGSPYGSITRFDRKGRTQSGLREFGTYFSTNKELAQLYAYARQQAKGDVEKYELEKARLDAIIFNNDTSPRIALDAFDELDRLEESQKPRVYEVFLNIRQPKVFDAEGKDGWNGWHKLKQDVGYDVKYGTEAIEAISGHNKAARMDQSYDGIIAKNIADIHSDEVAGYLGDVFLVFDENPNQIKSATETTGLFSENEDIRFSAIVPHESSMDEIDQMFASLNRDPFVRDLYAKVSDLAHKMNLKIKFVEPWSEAGGANILDKVKYNVDYFNSNDYAQTKAGVLLHELIHSVTVYAVAAKNSSVLTQEMKDAVKQMEAIYDEIKDDPAFDGTYGAESVKEMVSELSNPRFRQKLRAKNLFQRIIDAIKQLLGIDKGTNALDNLEGTLEYMIENFDQNAFDAVLKANEQSDYYTQFSAVTDPAKIAELESGEKIKVYRAMQVIDGKLYPPMSAKVDGKMREPIELGQWEQAEERPDLVDAKGNFKLDKANKSSVPARYNPYIHTSASPLNDQFSSAQSRPNLVTVEVEIPASELTSGYKAEGAKDAVGQMEWKAGVVQSKLSGTRTVILSRWDKPIRIVPDSEVAAEIVKMFDGKNITMPSNVVTPSLRAELEKLGVPFVETDNQGRPKAVTLFSALPTKNDFEVEKKAMLGISMMHGFVPFDEMGNTFRSLINEREAMVQRLASKANKTAFEKERLARLEQDLEAAYRQLEWWENVQADLVPTEEVQPEVSKDMEPQSFEEYLSQFFTMSTSRVNKAGVDKNGKPVIKKVNKKMGVMLTPETLTSEMGWTSGDWAGIRYIVSAKDGMSLDAIAEMIAEDEDAKQFLVNVDTMDIKNAVIDFLQSVGTYAEIRDYVKHQREAQAQAQADFINAQIQYNAQSIEDETGMTVDQYNAMLIEEAFRAAEENLSLLETSEINGNFEELTEDEYERYIEAVIRGEEGRVYEGTEDFGSAQRAGENASEEVYEATSEGDAGDMQGGNAGSVGDSSGEAGGVGQPPIGNKNKGLVLGSLETEGKSVDEIVNEGAQKVAKENADAADIFMAKLRKLNQSLTSLRAAISAQREYDSNTVKIITSLANDLLEGGKLTDMTRGEIKRLLSVIKDATGKSDLTVSVDRLMDIMIANQLRFAKNRFADLLKIKASKVNASGVEAQGKLDVQGQQIMQSLKDGMKASEEVLNEWIAEAENDLDSDSATIRHNAELRLAGYEFARQYKQDIDASEAEEAALREDLRKTENEGKLTKEQLKEYRETVYDAIRENKMARVNSYEAMLENMSSMLAGSVARAVSFREAEQQRVENIHHMANSDMQGMPADEHKTKDSWFWNNTLVRFLLKPLATFDQMLRAFAPKSRSGEGYLWNHFMGGWLKATEKEFKGIQYAHERLDAYVRYNFGIQRWSDLFALERKLPKAEVTWWNAGKMETFEVSQGNLLYIYMVNKMADGRMKLRKMGITEEDVDNIVRSIDPRFKDLADWLQQVFLPNLREKYNEVHERLFGAPMAAIDNYFPIRVLANARAREVDLGVEEGNAKPSTITGNIIKRTKNSLALDILGSNAFDVVLGHIEEMERWAAFAEWNKDLNTLLSYKKFRNRVQNMSGIYGAGNVVWNNFRAAAEIAAGVYRPATKVDSIDKTIMNIAKGVTGAKISFRVYTAFKQLLSWPAFISDARADILAKNMINPAKAWNWSMENLPLFEKRWKSRQAGDSRLMETESDWKIWKTKVVEVAGRWGMTPNALVDAVTVAIGARSIYETRLKKYLDYGYSQEKAEEKAKRDATILFNESQQSNESAFLSQVQVDRTVASVVFTVFRNSSMGYQRMYVDAIRNLGRMMKPGYKDDSFFYMTKQMMRDGLTEEQAWRAADRIYKRSFAKNVLQALTFGFIVQLAWNLGPYLPYIFGGDDDDKKDEMVKDATVRALVGGPVEGLAGGNILSNAIGNLAMDESLSKVSGAQLPLASDIENTFKLFENDEVRAYNELFNLAVQSFIGVNPQTISDVVVAVIDACNGDLETATEAMLCIMRILQVPQSQIENFYIDEIDFKADEAYDMTVQEFAERYAKYKVMRNAPLTQWMYTDEEEKKKEDKYIQLFTQKALEERKKRGSEEAKAWYQYVEGSEYKGIEQTLKDIRDQIEAEADAGRFGSDIIKAAQQKMIDLQKTPAFQKYMDAKMIKSQTDKLKEAPDWVDVSELKKMRKEKFDKLFKESNSVE